MRAASLLALVVSAACAGAPAPASGPPPDTAAPDREAVTLVNLHPDGDNVLHSINYLRGGLIPLCSRVSIHEVSDARMVFTVLETGKRYQYIFHEKMYESPEDNLKLYFGSSCNAPAPSEFTPAEQEAIRKGEVKVGMSKQAVVLAVGYPPWHGTASLESNVWRYWTSRYNTIAVEFRDGRVSRVRQ
jgi:hypothetical protein